MKSQLKSVAENIKTRALDELKKDTAYPLNRFALPVVMVLILVVAVVLAVN